MKDLKHPNIVEYKGYFEGSHELYIILELVSGGELFEHLLKVGKLPEPRARDVFTQLISAVHYFHSKNVCHRDIKPGALLLRHAPPDCMAEALADTRRKYFDG